MSRRLKIEAIIAKARSRPPGYADEVLSLGVVEGECVILTEESYRELLRKYRGYSTPRPRAVASVVPGPGTWTKWILSRFRIVATHGCKCNKMAKKMNDQGGWWCLTSGRTEILGVMKAEAEKRKLKWRPICANALIFLTVVLWWAEKAVFKDTGPLGTKRN